LADQLIWPYHKGMIDSTFAIALRNAAKLRLPVDHLMTVLRFLYPESETLDPRGQPIPFIASYLHQLFAWPSSHVRAYVLRFIFTLELDSPSSILQQFRLDFLIADSLGQGESSSDDEKAVALAIALHCIRVRRQLPVSILRSLICLYFSPQETYKLVIATLLSEALLLCHDLLCLPELSEIFISSAIRRNDELSSRFLAFVIEKQHLITKHPHFISQVLSPLSDFASDSEAITAACRVVSHLLRTWPGFFYCIVQAGGAHDLLECLLHRPDAVVSILRDILRLDRGLPFAGFAFYCFERRGVIPKLNVAAANHPAARSLLSYLLGFSAAGYGDLNLPPYPTIPPAPKGGLPGSLARALSARGPLSLAGDSSQWNWDAINSSLSSDDNSAGVYARLLDYFATRFLQETDPQILLIADSLRRLLDLVLPRQSFLSVLESARDFGHTLASAWRTFTGRSPEAKSPVWLLSRELLHLLNDASGSTVVSRWDIVGEIDSIAKSCQIPTCVEWALKELSISPGLPHSNQLFLTFLCSARRDVAEAAHQQLQMKILAAPGPNDVLLDYVHAAGDEAAVTLLARVMLASRDCLAFVANDPRTRRLLKEKVRQLYCVLLREDGWATASDVQHEVHWWLATGIYEYVAAWDDWVASDKEAKPPHLLSELVRSDGGLKAAAGCVPQLLKLLRGKKKERRAALLGLGHFSSDNRTASFVRKYQIVEAMVNTVMASESFILRGTLLDALSMMASGVIATGLLQNSGLTVFQFGSHKSVLPISPEAMLVPVDARPLVMPEILRPKSVATELMAALLNPVSAAAARAELARMPLTELATYDNKMFMHRLLMSYRVGYRVREFLLNLFRAVPLEPGDEAPVNLRVEAETYTRIVEALMLAQTGGGDGCTLSNMPIPVMEKALIKKARPGAIAPEVYLSDQNFVSMTGVDKNTFYQRCTDEQRVQVRAFILG
jgi:hypothetical protein